MPTFEERLARLEKENRRLKWFIGFCSFMVACAGLLAAAPKFPQKFERLSVTDMLTIGEVGGTSPYVVLSGTDKEAQISIFDQTGKGRFDARFTKGSGLKVSCHDKQGNGRVGMLVWDTAVNSIHEDESQIFVGDAKERSAISLAAYEDTRAIMLNDIAGKPKWGALVNGTELTPLSK